jgi:hypothetical protein
MKIRLKGEIDPELTALGLKAGDEIEVTKDPQSKVGCCHFTRYRNQRDFACSIWPENYDVINNKS